MFSGRSHSDSSVSSGWSYSASESSDSDLSVFTDDLKDKLHRVLPEKLSFSAQQLAAASASQHFPTFLNSMNQKCVKLHWACHVGWCLCKYQYQPLTPLHLLPNTPITDRSVGLASHMRLKSLPEKATIPRTYSAQEKDAFRLMLEGTSSYSTNKSISEENES